MVRFSRVSLRYPNPLRGDSGAETLRDLSFTLPQGSFTWLTGPSGAGKTSLLRLMQLALRPTSGEVEVLGTPVARAPRGALPALRRRIGAVFQEFRLLPYLTAFDNVALPLRLAGRTESSLRPDVTEILRWVGLSEKAGALPPNSRAGSSSAWPWPAPSSPAPPCSSPTNPRATWTPTRRAASWRCSPR
ncbi:cell division ATP-binding protein FtsE [Roseomonas sp. CCTCC AB2023176]|uniref:cell division ATP-binding protein FtsE n=1 Tax=Roseomonas sp. CCTCC AB2023176 TaxID=3342640 RepID=UPI0035DF897C